MSSVQPAHNLPNQLTPLLGRENDIYRIIALLNEPGLQLITLLGPGGIGKTRLALELALRQLNQFQDGIFLVSLTSVREPELVLASIAQTLEVKETAGQTLQATLADFLKAKEILLVLDNFEQIVTAAPEIDHLLKVCTGLKVLVTSRIPLGLPAETAISVPPLALPDAATAGAIEEVEKNPAVALFLQQAQLVRWDFRLNAENAASIIEICHRLDGLPLALELAAARIKTLSPQALLGRLNNRLKILTNGPRNWATHQQTLRATIDWSYELLSQEEKQTFTQLSVLEADWSINAAEAICSPKQTNLTGSTAENDTQAGPQIQVEGDSSDQLLRTIQSLSSKSLLCQKAKEQQRYWMLETIREYGLEKMAESNQTASLRWQHANYYLEWAEQIAEKLTGPEQPSWLSQLDQEYPNLRAALTCYLSGTETTVESATRGLRLGVALWRYWQMRGYLNEGYRWLEGSLHGFQKAVDSEALKENTITNNLLQLHARALTAAGTLARDKGDYQNANRLLEQSLDLQRRSQDKAGVATTLNTLGAVAANQGEFTRALDLLEESLALRQELADRRGQAVTLCNIAAIKNSAGQFLEAKNLYDQALVLLQELGDTRTISMLWNNYGEVQKALQDYPAARASFEKSLALREELGDKAGCAYSYVSLGELANLQGDYAVGEEFFSKALRLLQEIGNNRYIAICLEGLANTLSLQQELEMAARCLGAAEALREKIGAPLEPVEKAHYEVVLQRVKNLDGEDFKMAWAQGRDLPLAQTLDFLLAAKR